MKHYLAFIILIGINKNVLSLNTDSLKLELKKVQNDTARVKLLYEIGKNEFNFRLGYWDTIIKLCDRKLLENPENKYLLNFYTKHKILSLIKMEFPVENAGDTSRAKEILAQCLLLSQKTNDKKVLALTYMHYAFYYQRRHNKQKGLEYYLKSLEIWKQVNPSNLSVSDKKEIAYLQNNIALDFESRYDIPNALFYFFNALKVHEEIKNPKGMSGILNNIAYLYYQQKDVHQAFEYYTKSLKISESIDDKWAIALVSGNLGKLYNNFGDPECKSEKKICLTIGEKKALNYYRRSLRIAKEINNDHIIMSALLKIGNLYLERGGFDSAFFYLNESKKLSFTVEKEFDYALSLYSLSTYYDKQGDQIKTKKYLEESYVIFKKNKALDYMKNAAQKLSKIYYKTGAHEDAYNMLSLYTRLSDSLNSDENKKASIKSKYQYDYEKKTTADSVKTIERNKAVVIQLKQERTQRFALYGGIVLVILFAFFMLNRFRISNKQNKLITEQKSVLEHQKQEITDSINYSKRIQTAILPDLNDIKQNLNDFFILYQPKDIVSGDFYYFNKVNNDVFIAAADCTGHGVPGAFMSLVGSKELKIANSSTNSPAQILKHLNNGVKDTLRQNHIDGTKDGMDIALVRINGTTVTYSAANRPLWILKKDSNAIEEIKATKTAIAGFTEDNFEFEEHEINLTKGDTIYLFSDGYADQFGGDKQKKMTTKRFREFILSIKDLPMTKQQNELEGYFKNWQGNTEQVDDLLVIGITL